MGIKFTTTSSSLFNGNNKNKIPDWMQNLNFINKKNKELNIDFDKKGSWAEGNSINRDDRDYSPKEITAKLNDNEILMSKIELSKFLSNKYYTIKSAEVNNDNVILKTNISNIPGEFNFIYKIKDNKIKNNVVFTYNDEEYPFSVAGLEECLSDIKNNKTNKSLKVKNSNASIISREEIFRRYNGHIRQATDRINELLKDDSIIGVTSNSYGTYLDIDYLFPQQESNIKIDKVPDFEFVKNIEKNSVTEKKSAYQLAMEASKQFEDNYDDFKFINYERKGDKLKVTAKVLSNNSTYKTDVYFDIKNEKVGKGNFEKYFNSKEYVPKQHRLNNKNIISKKYVNDLLKSNGFFNFNIDNMFDKLVLDNELSPIDEDKYITSSSLNEILDKMDLKKQDKEKYYKLTNKISDLKLNRNNVKDTGIRENIKFSKEYRLATLNNYLSQKFNKFYIKDFKQLNNDNYEANVIFVNNGVKNKLHINANYNGTKINKVTTNLKNKQVSIKEATQLFKRTAALNVYLKDNDSNIYTDKIILTLEQIYNKLSNFVDLSIINDVINDWIDNNYIINIGGDTYASDYTFEELLEKSNINILSEDQINKLNALKQYFGEGQDIYRNDVNDTGIRETKEYVSHQTLINSINQYLSKYFNNFTIENLDINNNVSSNDTMVNYVIRVFNDDNGLSLKLYISFNCEGNTIKDAFCSINGENIKLDEVKNIFIINESLNKYLTIFNGKKVKSNIIISKKSLKNKLSKIANVTDKSLDDTIELLIKNNKMDKIAIDTFASKYTLEELINFSNLKPLTDEEFLSKIKKAQLNKLLRISKNYLNDNDTRDLRDNWSDLKIMTHIKSELNKYFKNYDVLNFELYDNKYIVGINATNNKGINTNIICYFNIDKNHPGTIIKITDVNDDKIELNKFLDNNKPNIYNDKGIITKKQLINNLFNIINIDDIDDIILDLVENNILSTIEKDKYTMDCTMSEVVSYLTNKNKTNLKEGQNNILKSIDKTNVINTDIKHDIENDTRKLVHEIKLSKPGEEIKDNLLKLSNNAYNTKKITLNKLIEIKNKLNNAKTEMDLNEINNELNKYLR